MKRKCSFENAQLGKATVQLEINGFVEQLFYISDLNVHLHPQNLQVLSLSTVASLEQS